MPVVAKSLNNLQVQIIADHEFHIHADEPVHSGGDNTGPDPYGLLLSSLAACKVMTVQMYARRKQWPLEEVKIQLDYQRVKAKDCEDCTSPPNANVDIITVNISFTGPWTMTKSLVSPKSPSVAPSTAPCSARQRFAQRPFPPAASK